MGILAWPCGGDEVLVAHRRVGHGELEDPIEDHAAAGRVAAVEPEGELVEVVGQVRGIGRALVGAQQPPLDQGCDPVHTGQQFARVLPERASGSLAAGVVDVAELVDAAVAGPTVGDHRGAGLDVVGDERVQRLGRSIHQWDHPASAQAFGRGYLDDDSGEDLLTLGASAG